MHKNDGTDAFEEKFTDFIGGDPPIPASVVGASILNAFQEEIARFIESSGITLNSPAADDAGGWGQMSPAVANYVQNGCFYFEDTGSAANNYVLKNNNLGNGTPTANPDRFTAGIFAWPIVTASADGAETFITLPGLAKTVLKKLDATNPMSYDLTVGNIALCAYDPSASHFKLLGTLASKRQYRHGIVRVINSGTADGLYGPSKWWTDPENDPELYQWVTVPLTGISGAGNIPGIALGDIPSPIDKRVESYISVPRGRYKISASMSFYLDISVSGPWFLCELGLEVDSAITSGRGGILQAWTEDLRPSIGVDVCGIFDFSETKNVKVRARLSRVIPGVETGPEVYWSWTSTGSGPNPIIVECVVERYDDF